LKWPPEIVPNAYTPVSTARPNASATPRNPIPTELPSVGLAANTAAPQPPKTNQNVPMNSAASRCIIVGSRIATPLSGRNAVQRA
jgi:hypothetical protein